jgi:hypothetical protein
MVGAGRADRVFRMGLATWLDSAGSRGVRLGASASAVLLVLLSVPAMAIDPNDPANPARLAGLLQSQVAQSSGVEPQRSVERAQPVAPPEVQRWSVQVGGLYTTRQGETAGWAPNVEVNYSPTDRLQLHAMMPHAYDRFDGGNTNFGAGDFEIGARYRLVDDDPTGWRPSVAFYPLIDFPTGDLNQRLGTGSTHAFIPLWFSKAFDQWIPFGGGGYWINPGPTNKDWGFVALGVVRVITDELSLTFDTFHATASKVGLKDQTGFDVGVRYNLTANHHFVVTVGRGLENADATNQFTTFVAYSLTF